jgi:hypothetical protein
MRRRLESGRDLLSRKTRDLVARDFASDLALAALAAQPGGQARIAGSDKPRRDIHGAADAGGRRHRVEVGGVVDLLKAMVGHQRNRIALGQGLQDGANQLVGALGHGVGGWREGSFLMGFGIQLRQMQ